MRTIVIAAMAVVIAIVGVVFFQPNVGGYLGRTAGNILPSFFCALRSEACGTPAEDLIWAENRAHAKDCDPASGTRIWHVRCEDAAGNYATNCTDLAPDALFKGEPQARPPVRAPAGDPAWTEVVIADEACVPSWNFADAHDKGRCAGGGRIYHVRCELAGAWSTHCPALPAPGDDPGGRRFVVPAKALEDPAWAEVVLEDDRCGLAWNDSRAHDKGCWNGVQTWHVRCETPNGAWSTACPDMADRSFKNKQMVAPPKRLPDRAWTEVKVAC